MSDRCAFIEAEKATTPISSMCARLGVSTSAFYAWRHRHANPTAKMRSDAELTATIAAIHTALHGVYGSPRVHAELVLGLGHQVNVKRVTRLMRVAGIQGISRRPRHGCTRRRAGAVPSDDLVHRQFRPDGPDRLWVGDVERHEALPNPAVVKGHRLPFVAADGLKLRAA
jgi:putative transposase